jgi:ERCC4-related helicase
MQQFGVLVFDECHHCRANSPYRQLMQDFYLRWAPASRQQRLLYGVLSTC